MLYSKNGSIPKPQTDGTEGWIEVPEPPVAGDGQEVVWWYPPGWVVRPVCPNEAGMAYNWSQSNQEWVATPAPVTDLPTDTVQIDSGTGITNIDSVLFSGDNSAETASATFSTAAVSADITLDLGSGVFGSAESTAGTASAMAASADITLDLGSAQPQ